MVAPWRGAVLYLDAPTNEEGLEVQLDRAMSVDRRIETQATKPKQAGGNIAVVGVVQPAKRFRLIEHPYLCALTPVSAADEAHRVDAEVRRYVCSVVPTRG